MTVETKFNEKFLRGPGAVFTKRAPGRRRQRLAVDLGSRGLLTISFWWGQVNYFMSCLEPGAWDSALKSLLTLVLLSPPIYSGPQAIIKKHLAPLSLGRFIGSLVGMDRSELWACPRIQNLSFSMTGLWRAGKPRPYLDNKDIQSIRDYSGPFYFCQGRGEVSSPASFWRILGQPPGQCIHDFRLSPSFHVSQGRHPIIPIFQHSIIPVVSAANLSSFYNSSKIGLNWTSLQALTAS